MVPELVTGDSGHRHRREGQNGEKSMKDQEKTSGPDVSGLEYTVHAQRSVEKTTGDPYFRDDDPEMILNALLNEIRSVSFGDYLRRKIREKKPENEAEDDAEWLCGEFRERDVPPSFTPTTAKLKALVKNWLSQRTVSRNVVLLLGFAMGLFPEEVNEFLSKALKEPKLDPKDPFEVICWYCYRFRLPFAKQQELWNRVCTGASGAGEDGLLLDSTVRVRGSMESIGTEAQLEAYLGRLGLTRASARQGVAARRQFDILYRKACAIAAAVKTDMERDDAETGAGRYAEELARNDRIYDYQKRERIERKRKDYRIFLAEDITPADIENILYSAVPKDLNGNLAPMKESMLNIRFAGKRLNRQHITGILDGNDAINRFDLITLCFFVTAGETDGPEKPPRQRYDAFIRDTNRVLADSDMPPLYVANPYESFVLMCMLADDPLGSFADVWELSYGAE